MKRRKVILVIRDGWGYRKETNDNAIYTANTPNTDKLMTEYPNVLLQASNGAVGLPKGYQGNSEVGHMTIGSGRIIDQSLVRINKTIEDGSFFNILEFNKMIDNCKKNNSSLHIMGLLQTQGVHSHRDHLFAILDLCQKKEFKNINIHIFTDGRDAPVTESISQLKALISKLKSIGFDESIIKTICGRYYSMDRDNRWDRTKRAYDCIVNAQGDSYFDNVIDAIKEKHSSEITDEFMVPLIRSNYSGVKKNDSMFFYNFRTDRTRQLTKAIVEKNFDGWDRKPLDVFYVAMTQFYLPMNAKVAFKDINMDNLLGNVISNNGLKQLRISETEKYAHVTFFFNGQIEEPNKGEDRILIYSPKVKTYDLKPEMSVYEIRDKLVENINKNEYDLIVTNLVNGDMVGHTGIVPAILKAVEAVDDCLGDIVKAGLDNDYNLLVFADHGNAEDQTPEWRTSHTTNPVPLLLISNEERLKKSKLCINCGLSDIAPTVLDLMNIEKPVEMEGKSVLLK
jgi:2,3-bisphosphoglycerate-independent phosphoglycerate mutase